MRSFRHHHPSPNEAEVFQFSDPLPDSDNEQKPELQVAEEKRLRLNSERREKRAKEKLGELKGRVEELETTVRVTSDEKEALREELEESARQNTELKQEVKRLTARFNSRVRREPQKIRTAVERALSSVFVTQQTVYQIKTRDGIIQNWARNVILHLVCACDVPAAKTWAAFSGVVQGLGISVEGSWSTRSAGRVVLEGALAAEEMIVEEFASALGRPLVSSAFILGL